MQVAGVPEAGDEVALGPAVPASSLTEDPIVALMAGDGYNLRGLLDEHVDDGRGWCRSCGGPQVSHSRWPCVVRRNGEAAWELRQQAAATDVRRATHAPVERR